MAVDSKIIKPLTYLTCLANREETAKTQKLSCHICQKALSHAPNYYNHLFRYHTKHELTLCILELTKTLFPRTRRSTKTVTAEGNHETGIPISVQELNDATVAGNPTELTKSPTNEENSLENLGSKTNLNSSSRSQVHHSKKSRLPPDNLIEPEGKVQNNSAQSFGSVAKLSRNPENSGSNPEVSATNLSEAECYKSEPVDEEQISFFNELGLSRLNVSTKSTSSPIELLESIRTKDIHPTKEHLYDFGQSTNFRVPVKFFAEKPLPEHDSIFDPLSSSHIEKLPYHESGEEKIATSALTTEANLDKADVRCGNCVELLVPNLREIATNHVSSDIATAERTSRLLNNMKEIPKLNPLKIKAPCNSTSNVTAMNVLESSPLQASMSEILSNINQDGHNSNQSCPIHTLHYAGQTGNGAGMSHEIPSQSNHASCNDRTGHDIENHPSDCSKSPSKLLYKKLYIKVPGKMDNVRKNLQLTGSYVPTSSEKGGINLGKNTFLPKEERSERNTEKDFSPQKEGSPKMNLKRSISLQKIGSSKLAEAAAKRHSGSQQYVFQTYSRGKKIPMIPTSIESAQDEKSINLIKATMNESSVTSPRENLASVSCKTCQYCNKKVSFEAQNVHETPLKDNALRVVNKFVRLKSNHEVVRTSKTDALSPFDTITEKSQGSENYEGSKITIDNHDQTKTSNENTPSCASETRLLETNADEMSKVTEGWTVKDNSELNGGKPPSTSRPPQFVDSNGIVWGLVEIQNGNHPLRVLKPIKIPDNDKAVNLAQEIVIPHEGSSKKIMIHESSSIKTISHEGGSKKRKGTTPKKKALCLKSVSPEKKVKENNHALRTGNNFTCKSKSSEIGNGQPNEHQCSKITKTSSSIPPTDKESNHKSSSSYLNNTQSLEGDPKNSSNGLDSSNSKKISYACVSGGNLTKSTCLELVPYSATTTDQNVCKEVDIHSPCTCIAKKEEGNDLIASNLDTKTWEMELSCMNSSLHKATDLSCQSSEHSYCCSVNTGCITPSEKQYFCDFCCKEYSRKSHLIRHHRIHVDDRPFECGTCQKKFTTKAILKQHERLHSGERPFSCTICEKTFTQKSSLLTHTMLHSGKPFKCFFCRFAVVSNHKLQRHLRRHEITDSGLYCCACDFQFSIEGAFIKHLAETHNYPPEFKIGRRGNRIEEGPKKKRKIRKQLLVG